MLNDIKEKIKNNQYSEGKGYGYILKNFDSRHLHSYLIIDYPVYINKFDVKDSTVKKILFNKQIIIEFLIDLEHKVLEVYSDKINTNRVINELSKLTNDNIEIDDIYFKTKYILDILIDNNIKYEIKNLRIKDFKINSSVNGSYFINYIERQEGIGLIKEYNTSIAYLGLNISHYEENISVGIYDSGSLRIYNQLEGYPDILPYLKGLFLHGDN
jgi:hypothetical protein